MKITEFLQKLEKCPALYIGDDDIRKLRHFLSGYIGAVEEYRPEDVDWNWNEFNDSLARKYSDYRTIDWSMLIWDHEPDGHSTDAFFRLHHDFLDSEQAKQ